jgi:5-methylcytosine-specific restriction endonuclease McrA
MSAEIISKIESLNKYIDDARKTFSQTRPQFYNVKFSYLSCPSSDILIRDGTNSYKFDATTISADYLKDIIEQKNKEFLLKNARTEKLKAKASAYDERERESAKALRKKNMSQLAAHPYCPYCNNPLSDADIPHYDHIYPVARGGLSTTCNMIFVCSSCNQKKRDNTLREFILKYELDESRIYAALDLLGKRF